MANASDATPKHASRTTTRGAAGQQTSPEASQPKKGPLSSGAVMMSTGVSRRTAQATRRAQKQVGHHVNRSKEHHAISILSFLVVALIVFGTAGYLARGLFTPEEEAPVVEPGLEVKITIPEGAGGAQIAEILYDNGVISDIALFLREVKSQEAEMTLKSGSYVFVTGANTREVVKQLVSGPNSTADVITIPEGYTVRQIADVCEAQLGIPADEFMARAVVANYVNDYPFLVNASGELLEGYLFPKTYDFGGKDKSADGVIRTMLNQYASEIEGLNFDAARQAIYDRYGLEFNDYELVTIASIIEKEASIDDERPNVASVFYNRMRDWMPLQSDATVGYVIDHAVTAEDLELDNPYNTYIYSGITPTPICNPGIESIKAALNPADTNYYYFLLIDDGDYSLHVFSETYDEHLAAIDQANADMNQ